MSDYYRTKKYRDLKRKLNQSTEQEKNAAEVQEYISEDKFLSELYVNEKIDNGEQNSDNSELHQNIIDEESQLNHEVIDSKRRRVEDNLQNVLQSHEERNNQDVDFKDDVTTNPVNLDYSTDTSDTSDGEMKQLSANSRPTNDSQPKRNKSSIRTRLHVWAIKHRKNLTRNCIDDLLKLLKDEGVSKIPQSTATLLPSDSTINFDIKTMLSAREKLGTFVYFGLAEGLNKTIDSTVYLEDIIDILINIDGMQLFQNSREQLWPILCLVDHKNYNCSPFIIAVFSGNAKPASTQEFFEQLIDELNRLILNGIIIKDKLYLVNFKGFVCDTPARAFIKGSKGHTGFCACERCEIHGLTINHKRVYTEVNCLPRTKASFENKVQSEHHVKECYLLNIIGFDPVKHVFLDSMHLLHEGIIKYLLEEWMSTKNRIAKLAPKQKKKLQFLLECAKAGICFEFQRKTLDLDNLVHWKATQFRFVLLYCSSIVLKHVLDKDRYKHFMLLFVACRILCSSQLALENAKYAKDLLEKFVILLPTYYGEDCQTINNHNLIHVADDVEHMRTSLSNFTAFPFENCLGLLKSLVKGRKDIVPQLIKRISEIEHCPELPSEFKFAVNNPVQLKESLKIEYKDQSEEEIESVTLKEMMIGTSHPDNVILLQNNQFIEVNGFLKIEKSIFVKGYDLKNEGDSFNYPCKSTQVGIYKLGTRSTKENLIHIDEIKNKCIILEIQGEKQALNFLHVS